MTVPSLTPHSLFLKSLFFPYQSGFLVTNHKNPLWLTETEKEFSEKLLTALRIIGKANEVGLEGREGQGGS